MRILVAEDDRALARGVIATLKADGLSADYAPDGETVLEVEAEHTYNTILLDVNLPGISGFEVLKTLRSRGSKTPILMLTARDAITDRIMGLDLGADDYVLKPFDPSELAARVRALIRRGSGDPKPALTVGPLTVDRSAGVAYINGGLVDLRRREFSVLEVLAACAGKVASRERIESQIFGYDEVVGPNALEVYVGRLRRKLEPHGPAIRTIRGVGYMIDKV
jgi:two-component system response regulator TctD